MVDDTFRPLLSPVLSVHGPWAWLLVNGHKPVENRPRPWKCLVGRWCLIHATARQPAIRLGSWDSVADWLSVHALAKLPPPAQVEHGGIVGRVFIDRIIEDPNAPGNRQFRPWFHGPKGYVITKAEPLPFVECPGKQGIWYTDKAQATP